MTNQNQPNPGIYAKKSSDIKELISQTSSMSEQEKQYWLQILPVMNEEQVLDLQKILTDEKQSLSQIDAKYSEQKAQMQALEQSLAKQERLSAKIKELRVQEAESEEKESLEEEKILNELD